MEQRAFLVAIGFLFGVGITMQIVMIVVFVRGHRAFLKSVGEE